MGFQYGQFSSPVMARPLTSILEHSSLAAPVPPDQLGSVATVTGDPVPSGHYHNLSYPVAPASEKTPGPLEPKTL